MKQRLYLDTSVFGGCFDAEFEDFSKQIIQRIQDGEFILLFSSVTQDEIQNAPTAVKELIVHIRKKDTEFLEVTDDTVELANKYIEAGVVGPTSYADCLHIAAATISKADYLVSWNFKHIVNVFRIRGYNSINLAVGLKELEIRSPRDLMKYEDQN